LRAYSEANRLALGILERLAASVHASGARLIVVHLPRRQDLEVIVSGAKPLYSPILAWLADKEILVQPEKRIREIPPELFQPRGHYSRELHHLVAITLVDPVLAASGASPGLRH
jgi:hypothetical protein